MKKNKVNRFFGTANFVFDVNNLLKSVEWGVLQKTALTPSQKNISRKIFAELAQYFNGKSYDFSFVKRASSNSKFFEQVYSALEKQSAKSLLSYQQLATLAGNPRASRAVGSAMAKNPWPVLVPCHKVVRGPNLKNSNSENFVKSENYSGPGGAETKLLLLKLEGAF